MIQFFIKGDFNVSNSLNITLQLILGQPLAIVDSTNDTLTLRWRGQPGMILQYRTQGSSDSWQRTERLTPDGTQEPVVVTIEALSSLTTYEVRAILPGQEEGRSARGEDMPVTGTTKPMLEHTESGFCVVLGNYNVIDSI